MVDLLLTVLACVFFIFVSCKTHCINAFFVATIPRTGPLPQSCILSFFFLLLWELFRAYFSTFWPQNNNLRVCIFMKPSHCIFPHWKLVWTQLFVIVLTWKSGLLDFLYPLWICLTRCNSGMNDARDHFSVLSAIYRCLKPDMGKKGKCKTQIKKRTLNPEYNEVWKRFNFLSVLICEL